jgi:glycosyltransferase involved in cell wall biosynthesis
VAGDARGRCCDEASLTAIDVIIPVFNRATTIAAAIDSVLAQACPAEWTIAVTVIDDGSSDDLAGALARYGDRVTLVRHDRNRGAAAARNTGVAAARGHYIALLDSDDRWLPGKLAAQVEFMRANRFAASCTAYYLRRRQRSEIVSPRYPTGALTLGDLVWGCYVSPGSTLVCERAVFDKVGLFDVSLQRLEDWDWLLRYARDGDLGFLAQPLAQIDVSPYLDAGRVIEATGRLKAKHGSSLPPREARKFAAALELERAAAHYRSGHIAAALPEILKSLMLVPFGNVSLAAVLHNHFARS